jgi:hypothetical protein
LTSFRYFSGVTLLAVVTFAVLLAWLNNRERREISEPHYAPMVGAVLHLPPYEPKETAIDVHLDRGWPAWYSRATRSFATHNAALYIDGPFGMGEFVPEVDYVRLAFDVVVAANILILAGVASEFYVRRCRPTRHVRRAESPSA